MTATPLNPAVRFPGLKNLAFYWVPTIANIASPTRSELDAGTDLTGEVASASGFSTDTDTIDAPDIASGFTAQLAGAVKAADSSLTIYMSSATGGDGDIRTVISEGDVGYVVRFDATDTAGALMDVFPCRVKSCVKSTSATDPMTVQVNFLVTSKPAPNVTVPADT